MPRQYLEIDEEPHWILRYITFLCRVFGLVTGIILWWTTIEVLSAYTGRFIGWYMLGVTIVFCFMELLWLLNKLQCCENDPGCCCTCWRILLWVDGWKKAIPYVAASILMFIAEYRVFYSIIAGIFIVICGFLNILKSFKNCRCGARKMVRSRDPEGEPATTQPVPPPASPSDSSPLHPD